jgi:hypothetical protein
MKYASAMPFTDQERERCARSRQITLERAITRRKAAPRGRYDKQPTEADKRLNSRILGEAYPPRD